MIRAGKAKPTLTPKTGERRSGTPSDSERTRPPDQERRSGIAMTPRQATTRRAPQYFDGPTPTLTALAVLIVLAVIFLGIGYTRPLHDVAPLTGAYHQTGTFSYTAPVTRATPVYPGGHLTTGQPIYPSLVDTVTLHFDYHFVSPIAHHISGTIELRALLLSQSNTWQELSVVKAATVFTGDSTTLVSSLPLKGLYNLVNKVSAQSGAPGGIYTVDLQPIVHISGTVAGTPVNAAFSPILPFTVAPAAITLAAAAAPAPPGATYVAPSAASALAATLDPTQTGSLPHLFPSVASVAKYKIRVSLLRTTGLVLAVLALLDAAIHDFLRRRKTLRSDEELIAKQHEALIVPVYLLGEPPGSTRLDVLDFVHLAGLAQFLERPILYEMRDGRRTYAVDDGARRYLYQPADEARTPSPSDPSTRRATDDGIWSESDRQAFRARPAEGTSSKGNGRMRRPVEIEADAESP